MPKVGEYWKYVDNEYGWEFIVKVTILSTYKIHALVVKDNEHPLYEGQETFISNDHFRDHYSKCPIRNTPLWKVLNG